VILQIIEQTMSNSQYLFSDRNQVHVVCTMTMNIIFYFIFKLDWMFIELVLLPMILLPSLTPPPPPCNGMGGGGGGYASLETNL
jgi:hypothetical protein